MTWRDNLWLEESDLRCQRQEAIRELMREHERSDEGLFAQLIQGEYASLTYQHSEAEPLTLERLENAFRSISEERIGPFHVITDPAVPRDMIFMAPNTNNPAEYITVRGHITLDESILVDEAFMGDENTEEEPTGWVLE